MCVFTFYVIIHNHTPDLVNHSIRRVTEMKRMVMYSIRKRPTRRRGGPAIVIGMHLIVGHSQMASGE